MTEAERTDSVWITRTNKAFISHYGKSKAAFYHLDCICKSALKAFFVRAGYQLDNNLCVARRLESATSILKHFPELLIIYELAVVSHGNSAELGSLNHRLSVLDCAAASRCIADMTNSKPAF